MAQWVDVCAEGDLPPGEMQVVETDDGDVGVFNCAGTLLAIEDRCSHDDGSLVDGDLDEADCTIECPRHGAIFDLRSGKPLTLPAYVPVDTYRVQVADGVIQVALDDD